MDISGTAIAVTDRIHAALTSDTTEDQLQFISEALDFLENLVSVLEDEVESEYDDLNEDGAGNSPVSFDD